MAYLPAGYSLASNTPKMGHVYKTLSTSEKHSTTAISATNAISRRPPLSTNGDTKRRQWRHKITIKMYLIENKEVTVLI